MKYKLKCVHIHYNIAFKKKTFIKKIYKLLAYIKLTCDIYFIIL